MNKSFIGYDYITGKLSDCDPNFPTELYSWDSFETGDFLVFNNESDSHYGFVQEGIATLITKNGMMNLFKGMYFSIKGSFKVIGGKGIVMTRKDHQCFFHLGGPVESTGRLKYIDGCTDSLLIPPIKMGDPCLNLLCFPEGIDQTEHTHPSDRIGVVYSGYGECVTPEGIIDLSPGMIFRIVADGLHKFRTLKGSPMSVIAYHPDSDFGPTDTIHPMINRTIVNGVSASFLDDIRTK